MQRRVQGVGERGDESAASRIFLVVDYRHCHRGGVGGRRADRAVGRCSVQCAQPPGNRYLVLSASTLPTLTSP